MGIHQLEAVGIAMMVSDRAHPIHARNEFIVR